MAPPRSAVSMLPLPPHRLLIVSHLTGVTPSNSPSYVIDQSGAIRAAHTLRTGLVCRIRQRRHSEGIQSLRRRCARLPPSAWWPKRWQPSRNPCPPWNPEHAPSDSGAGFGPANIGWIIELQGLAGWRGEPPSVPSQDARMACPLLPSGTSVGEGGTPAGVVHGALVAPSTGKIMFVSWKA
jgi:hypothetical protein